MKSWHRSRGKSPKIDLDVETFSLSHAKTYLGRLIEKARKGETVYIISGPDRFLLQEVPRIPPIPLRPAGYFANAYSNAEIDEANLLAKSSVLRPPRDLE